MRRAAGWASVWFFAGAVLRACSPRCVLRGSAPRGWKRQRAVPGVQHPRPVRGTRREGKGGFKSPSAARGRVRRFGSSAVSR